MAELQLSYSSDFESDLVLNTRLCVEDTFVTESNKEQPAVTKNSRSFFEFCKKEEKLFKSVLTKSPYNDNDTILESKVSKNTASFFLVEIILEASDNKILRNEIYNELRRIDDSIECLVSMFNESVSKRKFQILIDTSKTRHKRCQSMTVYNWVHTVLYNLVTGGGGTIDAVKVLDVDREAFNIVVQQPKDRQRAIRKVTEYDFDPLYTLLFSQHEKFSENYQIEHWARIKEDEHFDIYDKFVCQPGLYHSVGYLRTYLEKHQKKRHQEGSKQQKNELKK